MWNGFDIFGLGRVIFFIMATDYFCSRVLQNDYIFSVWLSGRMIVCKDYLLLFCYCTNNLGDIFLIVTTYRPRSRILQYNYLSTFLNIREEDHGQTLPVALSLLHEQSWHLRSHSFQQPELDWQDAVPVAERSLTFLWRYSVEPHLHHALLAPHQSFWPRRLSLYTWRLHRMTLGRTRPAITNE